MADPIPRQVADRLLRADSAAQRRQVLAEERLLDEPGLLRVVAAVHDRVFDRPGDCVDLARAVEGLAAELRLEVVLPAAAYAQAFAHQVTGDLPRSLELIETARGRWRALGSELDALSADLGVANVLDAQGRHGDALDTLEGLLARLPALARDGDADEQVTEMRGRAHQGRGVALASSGRYHEAIAAYAQAQESYAQLGREDWLAELRHNVGIELLNLGRVGEAGGAFAEAAERFEVNGNAVASAYSMIDRSRASLLLGRYSDAIDGFAQAQRVLGDQDAAVDLHLSQTSMAEAYLALNLSDEAAALFRSAADGFERAGFAAHRADAVRGLGAAQVRAGDREAARVTLDHALALYRDAGNAAAIADVQVERAALLADDAHPADALAAAEEALEIARDGGLAVQECFARLRLADLVGPETAEELLRGAVVTAEALGVAPLRSRVKARLGRVLRARGETAEAHDLLEEAVAEVEAVRGRLLRDELRVSFLADKVDVYEQLMALLLDRGDERSVRRAFEIAERSKSRALVDLLAGLTSARLSEEERSPYVQRLRQLQEELDAVYNEITDNGAGEPGPRGAVLTRRLAELEDELRLVRLQLPVEQAAGPQPGRAPADLFGRSLPDGTPLIVYSTIGDEVLAFVDDGDRLHVVRHVSQLPELHRVLARLDAQWRRFRLGQEFGARHNDRLLGATVRLLQTLYDMVLAPLVDRLGRLPTRIAIVPHGALHQVPFQALHDGSSYLLERCEVVSAPSVGLLTAPQPPAGDGRSVIVGVADPDIPAVATEVDLVAANAPRPMVLLDEAATPERVLHEADGAAHLHFACHGLFRPEAPMHSAVRLHGAWLTAAQALQLRIPGAVVALSACESGRHRLIPGGDELLGLVRGFIGAGATAVLVSRWIVADDAAAALMGDWYRLLSEGVPRNAALREAQLHLAKSHPHPYFWAPYTLIGAMGAP